MTTFTIGDVFNDTFAVLRRNLVAFLVSALLVEGVSVGLEYTVATAWIGDGTYLDTGPKDPAFWVNTLINLVLGSLLVAPITYFTYHDLRGRAAPVGQGLGRSFGLVPKVLFLSLVSSLLVLLALILFIVPGVIVTVMWWVAVPVLVVEGLAPLKSLNRSADLTEGQRWKTFAILVILIVPFAVIGAVEGAIQVWKDLSSNVFFIAAVGIVNALAELLTAVSAAVGYFHLRRAKEGVEIDAIAAVFD